MLLRQHSGTVQNNPLYNLVAESFKNSCNWMHNLSHFILFYFIQFIYFLRIDLLITEVGEEDQGPNGFKKLTMPQKETHTNTWSKTVCFLVF